MRTLSLVSLAASAASLFVVAVPARATTTYPAIVVYGDSLSDNGNLYAATGGLAPASPPYYNGRFSNGPVTPELLAAQLNAPLIDFAFGGATTGVGNIGDYGTQTSFGALGLPGMETELQGSAGHLPPALIPSSLFIVWGGADDFESLLYPFLPTPTLATVQSTAATAAGDIDAIVSALELNGATNILVPNLPNLGNTPEFAVGTPGNAAAIAYTSAFNTDLAATLPPGAILFNTYGLFNSLLTSPGSYGLTDTTDECILSGTNPACPGYLFFDDIHPTTAVDAIVASQFAAALNPTPEPSSLLLLGTGLAALTGFLRRRRAAK